MDFDRLTFLPHCPRTLRAVATAVSLSFALFLGACATVAPVEHPEVLFEDGAFAAPSVRINAADVFALSDDMRHYLNTEIAAQLREKGPYRGLFDALYSKGQLRLDYESSITRNAAEAFAARAGNCLSLVVMTAAFAKELGLEVRYESVYTEDVWSRAGGLYLASRHVTLTLGRRFAEPRAAQELFMLRIDFLAPEDARRLRSRVISEPTIVAMFLNNRAAEALVQGRLDDAYWWARAAILESPTFLSSFNTLGVIYSRHGDLPQAERVFRTILAREPANTSALGNLAQVLSKQGRTAEAERLQQELAQIQPHPPFHYFDLGVAAMQKGQYKEARDLFAKEVDRDGYYHEFHFWLGLANFMLGDVKKARKHLTYAVEMSTTTKDRELYAGKLAWLRAHHVN
ncbi:MAG TPA: tetratricopeptide repeat protein [Burkholderiaceae bacterium]|nr:tetratricopeptide repeat protein [Burkholderiaceae bacterium]